eukprot:gene17396-12432_t
MQKKKRKGLESEAEEEEEEEFSLSYRRPVAPPISGLPGIRAWTCARSVVEFGPCFGQAVDVLTTLIEEKRAAFVDRFPTPESVCADANLLELHQPRTVSGPISPDRDSSGPSPLVSSGDAVVVRGNDHGALAPLVVFGDAGVVLADDRGQILRGRSSSASSWATTAAR